ncbi:MAG: hypothetical protein EP332_11895 [Bacteroidetes bacterium]|nr:MAG: hypothetical protein EP332_11895 [Bacteroidota bacterium]
MKLLYPLSLALVLSACTQKKSNPAATELVSNFLENPKSLENIESKNPVEEFKSAAESSAAKVVELNKDNVADVLGEAKDHKHVVIVTGNHTVVKVDDLDDCKTSGSWGTCMPHAEGYIQRGGLEYQEDYINNIIGKPDEQERLVFFFD